MKKILSGSVAEIILLVLFFIPGTFCSGQAAKPLKSGYAPVNGVKLYYEVYGSGKPIVLLHGAFNTIDMAFGQIIPELAKDHLVIAAEMQGHGRTADTDRDFSFESMADDVAALMKYLQTDSADVLGYSMGGGIAWQLAIRHPEMVRKIITISSVYKYEGWSNETRSILPMLTPQMFEGTPVKTGYDAVAPDPKHWAVFVEKMKKFVTTPYDFGADNIKAIKSPTLIISGDGDGVTPEHSLEIFRLRHGSYMIDFGPAPTTQLAILPGTSHISVMMQTDWLLGMIKPFLAL